MDTWLEEQFVEQDCCRGWLLVITILSDDLKVPRSPFIQVTYWALSGPDLHMMTCLQLMGNTGHLLPLLLITQHWRSVAMDSTSLHTRTPHHDISQSGLCLTLNDGQAFSAVSSHQLELKVWKVMCKMELFYSHKLLSISCYLNLAQRSGRMHIKAEELKSEVKVWKSRYNRPLEDIHKKPYFLWPIMESWNHCHKTALLHKLKVTHQPFHQWNVTGVSLHTVYHLLVFAHK